MVGSNAKLERHKYDVSDIILSADGFTTPIKIYSKYIKSVCISNMYDKNVMPSVLVSCSIVRTDYEKVITNMKTMYASFSINRIYVGYIDGSEKSSYIEDASVSQLSTYIDVKLKVINQDDMDTNIPNKLYASSPKPIDSDEGTIEEKNTVINSNDMINLNLYLYDDDKINKYKINKSYILTGSRNDCMHNFFKDRGFTKVLASPSSDSSSDSFAIPYAHLGNNLNFLNSYYGYHDYPMLFYMGLDRNYYISKGMIGTDSVLAKGELGNVNIYLKRLTDINITASGCCYDKENKVYVVNTSSFTVNDNDTGIDHSVGGRIRTVVTGTGETHEYKFGDYNTERSVMLNNSKQNTQLVFNILESKRSVVLDFTNVDLDIFTPNKAFHIIPDDTFYNQDYEFGGKYRMVSSNVIINRSGDEGYKSAIQITLNKFPDFNKVEQIS